MSNSILIYAIIQFINVTISTIKYVVTVKSKTSVAAVVNALSYTISAVITYFITKQEVLVVILITFISNILGVPVGKWILDKFSKERLWVYHATVRCSEEDAGAIRRKLKDNYLIDSIFEEISKDKLYSIRFFAEGKEESRILKSFLDTVDAKYYIIEPR